MLKNFTRQLFAQLGRHLPHRLVQRDPLPDARNMASAPIPDSLGKQCLNVAAMDDNEIWRAFASHPEGLNAGEVAQKIARYGENQIPAQKPSPWWVHLWSCYRNPFNLLLTVLGIVSYSTEDLFAAAVIALMVGISTLLNFIQEARSTKAADALKAMVSNTATVLRVVNEQGESRWCELPIDQLVPGDIVKLSAGDMIPADLRVIQARDLFVAQASLTGESLPVEKVAHTRDPLQTNPLECDTLCFMGTNVVSGSAQAIVFATGGGTWFGQLAGRVSEQESEPNAFQKGISRVSMLLIRFMLVMTPIVLLINGYTKGDWWEAALFALSVAVGLTPEMLPMIVTSTLARGAVKLSKQKVIVKHLDAIQNFGAMDILCTDKTGTLTVGKPQVTGIFPYQIHEQDLLALAAAVEQGSTHPLAQAIVREAQSRGLTVPAATAQRALMGSGIEAEVAGSKVLICAADKFPAPHFAAQLATLEQAGQTVVMVVQDGEAKGLVALRDTLRDDAKEAVQALHQLGVKGVILTGDNPRAAAAIADELALDFRAGLLPADKVQAVSALNAETPLAMVGDGINDAPAMKAATIGIAMGSGTDVALETADAALTHNRLTGLAQMISLARATHANIRQNIAIALGLKGIFLVTTLLGLTGLWLAVLADTGATVLVTANALRLLRKK